MTDLLKADRSLATTSADKPNYCTPQVTPQVTPEVTGGVDETAKGEQEPVAYEVDADVINSQGQSEYRTFLAYRPDPAMTTGGIYEVTKVLEARPLYTAPPKREWVGLTDEEIYDYADKFLYQHGSNYGIRSFGKAIEAKLKEKNT